MSVSTDTTTVRRSAHADCTHPVTKSARAKCRRERNSGWAVAVRGENAAKGDTVRVKTADATHEGVLQGWGAARLVVTVDDKRVTVKNDTVTAIHVKLDAAQDDEIDD